MVNDMLTRYRCGMRRKMVGICTSGQKFGKENHPSERSHRFWGATGFSLTGLLIWLFAIFVVCSFLSSLGLKAIVMIVIGAIVVMFGWGVFRLSDSAESILMALFRLPFGLAIMAFGAWVIIHGLKS